jgi:hypothetical protein
MIALYFPSAFYASLHESLILMLNLLQSQIHVYSCEADHMPYKPRTYYIEQIYVIHFVFHYLNVNHSLAYTTPDSQWLYNHRPLLGNYRNRRTVFSMWSVPRPLLWNGAVKHASSLHNNRGAVLSAWPVMRSYLENNWGDPGCCQLRVQFCTGGCEEKNYLQGCGCEGKTLCVIFGVCNSVRLL